MGDDTSDDIKLVNIIEPKQAYEEIENKLVELLPSDQPDFIAQLEEKGIIDAEDKEKMDKKKMDVPKNDYKPFCTAVILEKIERSLTDSDEKFYALLDVMEKYKNGLDSVALTIRNRLDPVGTPFVCETMREYLWRNDSSLSNLPYNTMKYQLLARKIITSKEKEQIVFLRNEKSQMRKVIEIIGSSLCSKQTRKFKQFLELMEASGNQLLERTAQKLGGSERVPDIGEGTDRPTMQLLRENVIHSIAYFWHDVGLKLLDQKNIIELEVIKEQHPSDKISCASKMLELWLDTAPTPSWNQLIEAIREVKFDFLAVTLKNKLRKEGDVDKDNSESNVNKDIGAFLIPTSEEFMKKYLKAKHDLGSEKLNLFSILFFGPSGAGKSTLLHVLLEENIKSLQESTGILDKKLVQFKVAVQKETVHSKSKWKIVNIDEEIIRLQHVIEKNIVDCTDNKKDPTSVKSHQADMKIDKKLQSITNSSKSQYVIQLYNITSDTLIACYDSGGQPEFFDVMPAMTTITAGNIMVFDMSKNLHSQLDFEYFKQGKLWKSSDTKTHYTTVQLLKTALANIQSHATHYTSRSATNNCSKNTQLLVVGTHLDLCGDTEEEICGQLHKIEKVIWDDVLQDCSPISIIKRHKGKITKIIHPIANKSDKDSDKVAEGREEAAQEIRTAIENMSNNDNVNKEIEIPISWLLFQYEIKLHDPPCISRSDCDKIAKKCYIDEADIDDVLSFFHELGVLLHYKQVKKLEHVVFNDPQWLFNQLTKIIELKYDPSYEAEESIKKGIFRKKFLAEIFEKDFETKQMLHYEDLLSLFIHLNIMASLSGTEEQYFMPALLNPAPIDFPLDEEFGNKILCTLYIRFSHGFFPRSVFCCLIALSIQKNKTWKLQTTTVYKDVVVFQIENNREYLVLIDKLNYILVEIHHKEDFLQSNHQVLCYKLHENLMEVCSKIRLNEGFKFGFLCERCKSSESFASVQVQHPCYPEALLCDVCQHNPKMTYDQLMWFIPPKVMDIFNTKHSRQSNAKQKHEMDEPSDESESAKSKKPKNEEPSDPNEHHHKITHVEVYEKNLENLVKALPMDDVIFTTQLSHKKILPAGVDDHIKSLSTHSDKADYYLKNVIKPSLDIGDTQELNNLITVMEKCGYAHVERLAEDMKSDLK